MMSRMLGASLIFGLLSGQAACGDNNDIGTCTGECPVSYIGNSAYGTLRFEENGTQTARDLRDIAPAMASVSGDIVSLTCTQLDETFTLEVPASASIGPHDLTNGAGFRLVISEQSPSVPADLRGEYAVSDENAVYGTLDLTTLTLDKKPGFISGSLDATLARSDNPALTVHAQLQIQAGVTVP